MHKINVGVTWQVYGEYEIEIAEDGTIAGTNKIASLENVKDHIYRLTYLPAYSYIDDSLTIDEESMFINNQDLPTDILENLTKKEY